MLTLCTKILNLLPTEITAFLGDIVNTSVCSSTGGCLANNVGSLNNDYIDAWEVLYLAEKPVKRKEMATLTKVSYLLNDKEVKQLLGPNYSTELSKICKAYGGFSVGIIALEDYLTDVNTFCDIYYNTTGASGVVTAMKNRNGNVQDGLQHMLRVINTYTTATASTMVFEGNIAEGLSDADNLNNICTGCLYDVKLGTTGFEEFKSYQQTTVDGIVGSTKFYNQFKAYFSQISSMADLSYIFNMGKINQTGTIKLAFKNMLYDDTANNLSSKGSELFEVIWGNTNGLPQSIFGNRLEPAAKLYFTNSLVNDLQSGFYEFIKVK